jgi:uncharacterized membrane protein YoaK (UPF0700 family)
VTPATLVVTRGQEWRACTLAMVAGYADAYGIMHYQTFVSFMSGNTTQSGVNLGLAAWPAAVPTITAIACFVGGVFAGTLLAHSEAGHSPRVRFGLVAALMTGVVAATVRDAAPTNLGIAMLSFAMGVMNTTLSMVGGQAVALSYVTGTLNSLAQHLALACKRLPLQGALGPWDTHGRRALLLTGVWIAFLTGAALSAASARFGVWVLVLPIVILAAFAVWDRPVGAGTEGSG